MADSKNDTSPWELLFAVFCLMPLSIALRTWGVALFVVWAGFAPISYWQAFLVGACVSWAAASGSGSEKSRRLKEEHIGLWYGGVLIGRLIALGLAAVLVWFVEN